MLSDVQTFAQKTLMLTGILLYAGWGIMSLIMTFLVSFGWLMGVPLKDGASWIPLSLVAFLTLTGLVAIPWQRGQNN